MKPTQALTMDQQFFFDNGSYSYDPKTETPEQGRTKCAVDLAGAEAWGRAAGLSFEWARDDEPNGWFVWCYDSEGGRAACLGGVDFGDKSPWSDPYRRVVEAELAQQVYIETLKSAAA